MKKLLIAFGLIISSLYAYSQNGYSSVFLRVTDSATFVNSANTTAKHAANYADIWYSTVSGLFWKWSTVTNTYTLVGSGDNIYTSDGTLTASRGLNGDGFDMTFFNLGNFDLTTVTNMNFTSGGNFNAAGGNVSLISSEKATITATDSINFTAPIYKLGGLAPSSPTTEFFRGDGTWAVPAGGSGWATTGTTNLAGDAIVDNGVHNLLIGDLTGPYSYWDIDGTGPAATPNSHTSGVGTGSDRATWTLATDVGLSAATLTVNESVGSVTQSIIEVAAGAGLGINLLAGEPIEIQSSASTVGIESVGSQITLGSTSLVLTADDDINLTAGASAGDDIILTAVGSVTVASGAGAITDASTMDITRNKHTLTTSSATRTFTQSYLGDYSVIIITLNTTSCVFTFPAGALCKYNGVDSGDNTLTVTGVSGDKHIISILKNGTDYYVAGSKFAQ